MSDDYKPSSLVATYQDNPAPSALTKPFSLSATYDENYVASILKARVSVSFEPFIVGTNSQQVNNTGQVVAFVDVSFKSVASGIFDINFIRGIEAYLIAGYQELCPV